MSDDERPDNVTPIHRGGNGANGGVRRLRLIHLSRARVRPIDWLVQGWIERDAILDVIGDPSAGKSLLLLDLALCIATGTPWHGLAVQRGPVVYIAGEGHSGLARRRAAWEIENGITIDASSPIFVSDMETGLTDMKEKAHLLDTLDAFQLEHGTPVFIVIDTLARNFGPGDENDAVSMNAAAATLHSIRRSCLGASVATVHHTGNADKTRGRGSSALRGATDHEFLVTKSADHIVELKAVKMRDSLYPDAMTFRFKQVDLGLLDSFGEPVRSAVMEATGEPTAADLPPMAAPEKPKRMGRNISTALKRLQNEYERHRRNVLMNGRHPDTARVQEIDWRLACDKHDGMAANRWREAASSLYAAGTVKTEGVFVCLAESAQTWKPYTDPIHEATE